MAVRSSEVLGLIARDAYADVLSRYRRLLQQFTAKRYSAAPGRCVLNMDQFGLTDQTGCDSASDCPRLGRQELSWWQVGKQYSHEDRQDSA